MKKVPRPRRGRRHRHAADGSRHLRRVGVTARRVEGQNRGSAVVEPPVPEPVAAAEPVAWMAASMPAPPTPPASGELEKAL